LQDVVYNDDEKKPDFQAYVLLMLYINQEHPNDKLRQLVAMSEVYRQAAIVVVLLEKAIFGNGQEFTLNKAAILTLKRWTQDVWSTSMIHGNNILSLLGYAKQNGNIEAAKILTIFYKIKEFRIRRAVSLSDAWYLVSNRLTDDPLNYILGILGMLHPMIKYHFIREYKSFEDGMQQILRLTFDNLPVPKNHFDVEYDRSGVSGWKIEYNNDRIGVSVVYGIIYKIDIDKKNIEIENNGKLIFEGTFTLLDGENLSLEMNAHNDETHLINVVKGGTSDATHWISIV
ncbi:3854_t:CDS:2, partial [Gigaspora rosea]